MWVRDVAVVSLWKVVSVFDTLQENPNFEKGESDLPATTMSWESPLNIFISFSVGFESLYGSNNVDMMSGVVVII